MEIRATTYPMGGCVDVWPPTIGSGCIPSAGLEEVIFFYRLLSSDEWLLRENQLALSTVAREI
jgi:hypothetical protein